MSLGTMAMLAYMTLPMQKMTEQMREIKRTLFSWSALKKVLLVSTGVIVVNEEREEGYM